MSEKKNLHLLILCCILCQEIFATLSDDNTKESSDFLVRKKRVISHLREDQIITRIEEANYLVRIKQYNIAICVGAILSHYTILTAASCARDHVSTYKIGSGGAYDHRSNNHNMTSKIFYNNSPYDSLGGIALVNVDPPFVFNTKTGKIGLFTGILSASTEVTVHGWGCFYPLQPGSKTRPRLLSITLPIMNHEECQNIYRRYYAITEKYLCTYHEQKYCAHKDIGAPLVVNNKLVGVHVWKGEFQGQKNPDVFINLLRNDYSEWIREHVVLL